MRRLTLIYGIIYIGLAVIFELSAFFLAKSQYTQIFDIVVGLAYFAGGLYILSGRFLD